MYCDAEEEGKVDIFTVCSSFELRVTLDLNDLLL